MTGADRRTLVDRLIVNEGLRLKVYLDTKFNATIGIGRNLSDKGISRDEALYLCGNDIDEILPQLDQQIPWWTTLDGLRQGILVEIAFNAGVEGLMGFHKMLADVQAQNYDGAADEIEQSELAQGRRDRLAALMRTEGV